MAKPTVKATAAAAGNKLLKKNRSENNVVSPDDTDLISDSERLEQIQNDLSRVMRLAEVINQRESSHEKVFNALHRELRDYKDDFIYEHLKPIVRPLLFLYDSMDQFGEEINTFSDEHFPENERFNLGLVQDNIQFFRDQLVEALQICEVTRMETPSGLFNPKLQTAIDVVPVKTATQDGIIQRVVRSGWYMNRQVLRPAEVVIGKKM